MADKKPKRDNFISKIVKDPTNPPKTILLKGYLGESSEEGHTRLYLDAQLSNYVEVPDEAILHEQEVPKDQSPLGETYVWIDQDAQVIHGAAGPQRQKSKFLEGPIAAAAVGAPGPAGPIFTFICTPPPPSLACPITPIHGCPPPTLGCPITPIHGCPPPTLGCPITPIHGCPPPQTPLHGCQVSQLVACPTLVGPACGQVVSAACPPQTPLHGCPTLPAFCPVTPACPPTPFHPCVTQVCTIAPQCHTPACPPTPLVPCHTPLHGCPTPPAFCPPTPLAPCHTPLLGCPTGPTVCCPPTPIVPCHTPLHGCPTPPAFCPVTELCPSLACPTKLGCPTSTPQFCPVATPVGACGGGPGDPGTPVINPGGGIINPGGG